MTVFKEPAVRLTADLCARAVIAAARSYGVCPVELILQAPEGAKRKLAAAIPALALASGRPFKAIERIFGLTVNTTSVARLQGPETWRKAEAAARRAVEFAGWRAEACPVAVATPCDPSSEPLRGPPPPSRGQALSPARGEGARVMAAKAVRREVLAVLAEDPSTGPELMDLVGVGEGQIRAALSWLVDEGRVIGTKLTAEGWGVRTWSLIA